MSDAVLRYFHCVERTHIGCIIYLLYALTSYIEIIFNGEVANASAIVVVNSTCD